ncbi:MAG: hypothetical protein NTX57_00740 [Armatimonadetes bacterium]|nr:hypothetical protein [Armatimonadota bacterium]
MKITLLTLCALVFLALAGCSKTEPSPTIDPATAKAQPGADTPAAVPNPAATAAQKAEKSGG